ncbi:MAG TPA: hypothetical protein VIA06_04575 [Candidatus Dormibacteraeota bacterium]|nr:hypothetical protein [Candidatus Dormibacteraeota bacterium]
MNRRPSLGRRAFLGGMLGVAGTAALASCGGGTTANVVASCVSGLNLPITKPPAKDGAHFSKVPNVPVAWTKYPTPWKSWTGDPPAKGGSISAFEILWGAPPPPVQHNPWWQSLNKQLGASYQVIMAAAGDYPDKLSTLAASGSFPDITYINFSVGGTSGSTSAAFEKYVDEGAFHDLTPYLTGSGLKEFPNLQRLPKLCWQDAAFEGKIFGPPYPIPPIDGMPIYRKDWAQKLGVDNPKNAQDLKKMFTAFAKGDPNKSGKQDTWSFGEMDTQTLAMVFHVPNNWKLDSKGKLTKDIETDEYKRSLDFAHQLWNAGAYHPDVLTNTYNFDYPAIESGHIGYQFSAIVAEWDTGGIVPTTEKQVKGAKMDYLPLPGADGGSATYWTGSSAYGFYGIPSSIKSEKRVKELLHVLDWWTPPFGSEEFTFIEYGIEGLMYKMVDGVPTATSNQAVQGYPSGINYMCQPLEINFYYVGAPQNALLAQRVEGEMLEKAISDPTTGLYSPTDVSQGAALDQMIQDNYNNVLVGRQPLSSLDDMISSWKSQGGEQIRTEYQKALSKCK